MSDQIDETAEFNYLKPSDQRRHSTRAHEALPSAQQRFQLPLRPPRTRRKLP